MTRELAIVPDGLIVGFGRPARPTVDSLSGLPSRRDEVTIEWAVDEGCRIARPAASASTTGLRVTFEFDRLVERVRACTVRHDAPRFGEALPHAARPAPSGDAFRAHPHRRPSARRSCSLVRQAIHGPIGVRLRAWLGLAEPAFYDARAIAIIPGGFAFRETTPMAATCPRDGNPRKADGAAEAKLIALTCSPAPEGFARWSLRLLEEKVVELNIVE